MKVALIKAEQSDAEELLRIQKHCFAPHLVRYEDYEISPATQTLEKMEEKISNEAYYKIMADDCLAGGICVKKLPADNEYYLRIIYVLPDVQGKGVGQTAIRLAEEQFPDANVWYLETLEDMPGNRHVYEKMGYLFTGKKEKINEKLTLVFYKQETGRNSRRMPAL